MSTCDFAVAAKSIGEWGSVFTLNGSYSPRASTFGVTPLAGSAHTRTPQVMTATANTIPAPIVLFFIAASCRKSSRTTVSASCLCGQRAKRSKVAHRCSQPEVVVAQDEDGG